MRTIEAPAHHIHERTAYGSFGHGRGMGVVMRALGPDRGTSPAMGAHRMPAAGIVQPHVLQANRQGRNIDPSAKMRSLHSGAPQNTHAMVPGVCGNVPLSYSNSSIAQQVQKNLAHNQQIGAQWAKDYTPTNTNPLGQAATGTRVRPDELSREQFCRNPSPGKPDPGLSVMDNARPQLMSDQGPLKTLGSGQLTPEKWQQHQQFMLQAQPINDPVSPAERAQEWTAPPSPFNRHVAPGMFGPGGQQGTLTPNHTQAVQ